MELAATYYAKQQMLEEFIAPDNAKCRRKVRDHLADDSWAACCALPGLEEFLYALACSATVEYYPNLHVDHPQVGALECILFSSSEEAVFVAQCGGSDAHIEPLSEPKLILLDSARTVHGAQKSREAAHANLKKMKKTA